MLARTKGFQLKDAMLERGLLVIENPMLRHGSDSSQIQYPSLQETNPNSYSPATNSSSGTCSRRGLFEPSYPPSMPTDHPSESIHHKQSGPDMILLDEMRAPNPMPVFGGEGYNQSPFAIPEERYESSACSRSYLYFHTR
jgi:hypothetical protein